MSVLRILAGALLLSTVVFSAPASAQFYFKSKDVSGAPVKGDEPGIADPLPGASDAEIRANLLWTMRAALNIAALQCQFEPTLLTVSNYNYILKDHAVELKKAYDTLGKYFVRMAKSKAAGQAAFDSYGTRTYSSLSTTSGQYGFCQAAGSIGNEALFTPRGELGDLASRRMRELRNAMVPWGEQQFRRDSGYDGTITLPRLDPICWDKKGFWNRKKCGDTVQWMPDYLTR
jgi:hypothetical protein